MAPPEIFWSTLHTQLESLANNVKHESTTTSLTSSSISVLSLSQAARRVSVDQARDTVMPLLEQGRSKFHGEVAIQTIIHTLASVSIMVTVTSDEASASSGKAFLKECCLHQSSPRDVWCCALGLILDVSGGKSCAASFLAFYFGDLLAFYFSEEDEEEGNDVNGYQNDCELSVDNEERIFFVQGTQRLLSIVIEVLLAIPQDGIAEVFGCPLSKKSEEETYDKQDIGNSEYTPDDLDDLMGSTTPLKQRKRLTLREKVEAAGILCDGIESDNENENENLAEPTSVECDVEESDGDEMEAMTLARFVNGALGSKDGSVKKLALEAIAVAAAKDPNSFASPAAAIFARAALSLTSSPLASASSSAALSSSFNFKATCVRFASECIRKGGLSALQSAMPELGEYICQHDGCAAWGHASATALACLEWDDAFGGSSNCTNSSTCDLAMSLIMAQLRGFTGSGSLLDRLVWKATSNATALQCICNVAELATRRILDDTRFNLEEVLCGTAPPCEFRDVVECVVSILIRAMHNQEQRAPEFGAKLAINELRGTLIRCVAEDLERTDEQGYAGVVVQWLFGDHGDFADGGTGDSSMPEDSPSPSTLTDINSSRRDNKYSNFGSDVHEPTHDPNEIMKEQGKQFSDKGLESEDDLDFLEDD